jgi:hypothetical protein
MARSMVTRYGLSDKLGNVAYDRDPHLLLTGSDLSSPPHERDYAEKTATTVDEEVRALWRKHFNAPSVSRVRLPKSVNPTVYGIDRCPWVSDLSTDIVSCQAFCTRRRFSSRLLTR